MMTLKRTVIAIAIFTVAHYGQLAQGIEFIEYSEHEFNDHIYTLVTEPQLNWTDAVESCKSQGLELSSARNPEEYEFFKSLVVGEGVGHGESEWSVWFWGKKDENGVPRWLENGKEIADDFWAPDEPDNAGGKEHCISLWYRSEFHEVGFPERFGGNDDRCERTHHYFCRTPIAVEQEPVAPGESPVQRPSPCKCFRCANRKCGRYPDEHDCQSYWHCFDDKSEMIHQTCPNNLRFNPEIANCDRPEFVPCPQSDVTENITENDSTLSV